MSPARGARLLAFLIVCCLGVLATPAAGAPTVKLHVALRPEHLGAGTTMDFRFEVAAPAGHVPPPLTGLEFRYPANFGLLTSGLGLASCAVATLEAIGPAGCPSQSQMGIGSAVVDIPFGPEVVRETGQLTAWMAPSEEGHIALSFYANGISPVLAQLIFPGVVLDASQPFGGRLHTRIPVIPSLPEAPDASVVRFRATIGPLDVTYFRHSHGHEVGYQPNGILLPDRCPRGGFPFEAAFVFLDGTHTASHTSVACPRHR